MAVYSSIQALVGSEHTLACSWHEHFHNRTPANPRLQTATALRPVDGRFEACDNNIQRSLSRERFAICIGQRAFRVESEETTASDVSYGAMPFHEQISKAGP